MARNAPKTPLAHLGKPRIPLKLHNSYNCRGGSQVTLAWDLQVSKHTIELTHGRKLNWPTNVTLLFLHAGAIAALFVFSWKAFALTVFFYWVATGLGISMGYHRLHTHRSYRVPLWLEYFFALCGSLTLEGGPIFWVAVHRIHHQKSDLPGDPLPLMVTCVATRPM